MTLYRKETKRMVTNKLAILGFSLYFMSLPDSRSVYRSIHGSSLRSMAVLVGHAK